MAASTDRWAPLNFIFIKFENQKALADQIVELDEEMSKLKDKDYSIFSIEEQQELSGVNLANQNDSVIGKLFGYIFNG